MDGYIATFKSFAGATQSTPKGPEDYADKLNYQLTPSLLLIIATIVGMRQYVFQAIQCWMKKEHEGSREEFVENYCWIHSTFYYDDNKALPHTKDPGAGQHIFYYQWIPFILMGQAMLFYLPHLIWMFLSSNSGVNVRDIMVFACSISKEETEEKKEAKIRLVAQSLQKFVKFRSAMRRQRFCARCINFIFGKPTFAMYLIAVYFIIKLLYITNCIGQIHLMRNFLGLNMSSFGFQIMNDIMNNRTWETSNVFPRITYCKLNVRSLGGMMPEVSQCVLPVNMLNEKFYILIWFWVMMILTLNVISLIRWLCKHCIGPNRRRVIKKLLKIAATLDNTFEREKYLEKEFINRFLETDGIFVLSMITSNSGDMTASEIIKEMWKEWRETVRVDSQYIQPNNNEKMPLEAMQTKGVIV